MVNVINHKKIMIFGGTGSLGTKLIQRYVNDNTIVNYSRDETKQWHQSQNIRSSNLHHIMGDIRDRHRVEESLTRENPNIIVIAAALKHIDKCEYASNECLQTNIVGPKNILDAIENKLPHLTQLDTVCFVSTDKACSPVNLYGICKAASEKLMIEKSKYIDSIKFVCVRYGNVLNSRGSIIPLLHGLGKNPEVTQFNLTHPDMTRFVMTLEQSVDLIEHAILSANSGDVVIPRLTSMKVSDMFEIFSEIYDKPVVITGLRPGEKMLESLINETQSMRTEHDGDKYHYIRPPYLGKQIDTNPVDYNSKINPLNKEELREYLQSLGLI